ncbi:ABC transporter permease [Paludifilum halophilum]|nr:ABC transporter permease [Paludifilum halophilum]
MKAFWRICSAEWKKTQWWLVGVLAMAGPALGVLAGNTVTLQHSGMDDWTSMFAMTVQQYGWLFFPIIVGVFAALVCRYEHVNGGWKHLLALPVSRTHVYLAKGLMVAFCIALCQLALLLFFVAAGQVKGLDGDIPWGMFLQSVSAGWVAALPLAALQLWVSFVWRSFGVPLAINVIFTLPSIFALNSETFAPYYPWAQPVQAMIPAENGMFQIRTETLTFVIISGFLLAAVGGWQHFLRREVTE